MSIEKNFDEDGNPIEDENPSQKNIDELVEKNTKLETDLNSVVDELKNMRKDRADLKDALEKKEDELKNVKPVVPTEPKDTDNLKTIVQEVLGERDVSDAKANQTAAFEKFITNNKVFSKENDPSGLKRLALEDKVKMFNTSKLKREEDFYNVIKDSASLLGISDTDPKASEGEVINPYSSTPMSPSNPTIVKKSDLSTMEQELIKEKGWTEEKYLKLKEKNPAYFEQLLN